MNRLQIIWLRSAGMILLWGLLANASWAQQHDRSESFQYFDETVAPVLAAYCLECHSGVDAKGRLDLSVREKAMAGGKGGPVISPGEVGESRLWELVNADEMPPKHPLPDVEKEILKEWIAGGAHWGTDPIDPYAFSSVKRAGYDWWSLQPLKDIAPPEGHLNASWPKNELDQFIATTLSAKGLSPSPRADARTLVRRLYVDLLGLPAPMDVIETFTANPSDEAWGLLVDGLLDSPHYGERWARHWMDVARFGESGGFEYNTPRESAWHYRDWLIRAFNDDMPYDEFARMQLAGDIFKPNTLEGAAAVGFLVAGVHNEVQGVSDEMKMTGRQDELEEISGTVGQTFLGMTVHCARCHDHKFDPISITEYYQFIAALDGIHHATKNIFITDDAKAKHKELAKKQENLKRKLVDLVSARNGEVGTTANRVTLKEPIKANEEGIEYSVSLKLAPTVWAAPGQSTVAGDGVLIRISDGDNETIVSQTFEALPWDGGDNASKFISKRFTYQGTGSGGVSIHIEPAPLNSGRFGGAADDLVLRRGDAILFEETFDTLKHPNAAGKQADTGNPVFYASTSEQWSYTGANALHAVEHVPGNVALQLFGGSATSDKIVAETPEEKRLESDVAALQKEMGELATPIFTVRSETSDIMRVHHRGSVRSLGDEVVPGGLQAIRGLSPAFAVDKDASDAKRRKQLAEWMTAPENSLFHRVIVNRIWHYHFGRGIVDSPNDFGFNGGQPSHPELLDWLALWFRENSYSMKALHRLIVTSSTYQQASSIELNGTYELAQEIDKDNRFLWRQNPRRLAGETLRDSMLVMAGALNPKMYGPGYKDVRLDSVPPANYYIAIDPVGHEFNRRTIYRWHVRGQRSALLDTFDCPDPSVTTPMRSVTTTPSQALSQWNHSFVLRMAKRLGERIEEEVGTESSKQVIHAWHLVLGRNPRSSESMSAQRLVEEHCLSLLTRALLNSNESIFID